MKVKVEDIVPGDRFVDEAGRHHWTAMESPTQEDFHGGPGIVLAVQYADHGRGFRTWDPGTELEVEREGGGA